jgi:putative Holliday junction resolvase
VTGASPGEGRILGIDFGERRTGVALSDPTGFLASPFDTITRRPGKRPPLKALEEIGRAHEVVRIVVGLPLDLGGRETPWCAQVRKAADELGRRLETPVEYVDERFSSVRAERAVRAIGLPKRAREEKGRVDRAAAAVILQSWLDARHSKTQEHGGTS